MNLHNRTTRNTPEESAPNPLPRPLDKYGRVWRQEYILELERDMQSAFEKQEKPSSSNPSPLRSRHHSTELLLPQVDVEYVQSKNNYGGCDDDDSDMEREPRGKSR